MADERHFHCLVDSLVNVEGLSEINSLQFTLNKYHLAMLLWLQDINVHTLERKGDRLTDCRLIGDYIYLIQRLKGQPGIVLGHGFNQYHTCTLNPTGLIGQDRFNDE